MLWGFSHACYAVLTSSHSCQSAIIQTNPLLLLMIYGEPEV